MGATNFANQVYAILEENQGKNVSLEMLRKGLGFDKSDTDKRRIQNAISGLSKRSGVGIDTIVRGAVWRLPADATSANSETSADFKDEPEPEIQESPSLFERVGNTKSGIMLRDDNGDLWLAKRM